MANGAGFPGRTNKVYPDPVPKEAALPSSRASAAESFLPVAPGSVALQTSSPANPSSAATGYPATPMGARKDQPGQEFNAPVGGYPQPGKKGHP